MSNSSFLFVSEPQVLNPELCVSRACILLLSYQTSYLTFLMACVQACAFRSLQWL